MEQIATDHDTQAKLFVFFMTIEQQKTDVIENKHKIQQSNK